MLTTLLMQIVFSLKLTIWIYFFSVEKPKFRC